VSYARSLATLCGLALVTRLAAVVLLRAWQEPYAMEHAAIAMHLVAGRGFAFSEFGYFGPSSVQSPTYPILLAGLFRLLGVASTAAYAAALGLNCLLGGLATAGSARLARALGGSPREALLAAGLVAVWPTQVYAATHAQAVCLIIACSVWMMTLFPVATQTGRLGPWLAYALISVLGSLTEPSLLPMTALSGLLILFWRPLAPRVRLRNAAILLAAALLVIGPWTLRNWQVHGALMPVKSSFWVNVWKGANDHASGTDRLPMPREHRARLLHGLFSSEVGPSQGSQYTHLTSEQLAELEGKPDVEREAVFRRWATDWIRRHPRRYAELCLVRLGKSLGMDWDNPKAYHAPYLVSRVALLLLSVPGLCIAVARGWQLFYPLALFASVLALNTLVLTAARFALPLEPFQLVLGAASLGWLLARLRPDRWSARLEREGTT